jgi:thiol:disulfide interchange protein DsbD
VGVCGIPRGRESLHFPLGFQGYFDFQEGLSCAQQQNKPVLLVFKGHACANCKKMEASLWPEPEVRQLLNQEFILIALYTDDRTLLPEDEWVQSTYDKKWKKTMGQVNMDFQISQFGTNTQPWHIILSPRGTVLTPPLGYTNHPKVFADFLRSGLEAFRQESL